MNISRKKISDVTAEELPPGEFLKELEDAEKDWKKRGGLTLEKMKKKYL